jgi:hemerythrin-like domain-containing protein
MEFELKRIDPVRRQPEHGLAPAEGLSPMDPPDAYAPPSIEPVPPEQMHPYLRQYLDEHVPFLAEVSAFEEAMLAARRDGYTKAIDGRLRHFFNYFDEHFIGHYRDEEAELFPLLRERLIAAGEHGSDDDRLTAIDLMEDEHLKAIQLAAVIVNFLGLAFRFPDERSRLTILDAALEQGKALVELLRLHIFREDNVVFALAHRHIGSEEFERMQRRRGVKVSH